MNEKRARHVPIARPLLKQECSRLARDKGQHFRAVIQTCKFVVRIELGSCVKWRIHLLNVLSLVFCPTSMFVHRCRVMPQTIVNCLSKKTSSRMMKSMNMNDAMMIMAPRVFCLCQDYSLPPFNESLFMIDRRSSRFFWCTCTVVGVLMQGSRCAALACLHQLIQWLSASLIFETRQ